MQSFPQYPQGYPQEKPVFLLVLSSYPQICIHKSSYAAFLSTKRHVDNGQKKVHSRIFTNRILVGFYDSDPVARFP